MPQRMPSISTVVLPAVPLVLVPALGIAQGGYLPGSWVWATPLAAWALALAALHGGAGGLRRHWPWAAAAAALLAWTAASAAWSDLPAQSWLEARRALLYLTVALALLALARRGSAGALVTATHAGVCVLLGYALGRYLLGTRTIDPFEAGDLFRPIGYANATGIVATAGLLLGLGIAARDGPRRLGVAACASLPPLALALSLTGSRGSLAALTAGALVLLALEGRAAMLARAAAAALPGTALLVALAAALDLGSGAAVPSRAAGAATAAATVACAAATALLARRVLCSGTAAPGRDRRATVALLAGAAAVAVAALVLAGRSEPRASYWHVAWHDQALAHPELGTGAGTFGAAWLRSGLVPDWGGALDAHSLYLETLAELGPVGLVLLAVFLVLPLATAARRHGGPAAPAAAAAYAAFLVHAGLDWDWEVPAVVVVALACGAALVLGDREPPQPRPALRTAAFATALLLGAAGLAGARSDTVPSAAETARAPATGALATPPRGRPA